MSACGLRVRAANPPMYILLVITFASTCGWSDATAATASWAVGRKLLQPPVYAYVANFTDDALNQLQKQASTTSWNWFLLSPAFESPLPLPSAKANSLSYLKDIQASLASMTAVRPNPPKKYSLVASANTTYLIQGSDQGRPLPTIFAPDSLGLQVEVSIPEDNSSTSDAPALSFVGVVFANVTLWAPHISEASNMATLSADGSWTMVGKAQTCFANSTVVLGSCTSFPKNVVQYICFSQRGMVALASLGGYIYDQLGLDPTTLRPIDCISLNDVTTSSASNLAGVWVPIVACLAVVLVLAALLLLLCCYRRARAASSKLDEAEQRNLDLLRFNLKMSGSQDERVEDGEEPADLILKSRSIKRLALQPVPNTVQPFLRKNDLSALQEQLQSVLKTKLTDATHIKVEGEIGRGAYGVVYKGTWKNMRVAIKTILFYASQDLQHEPVIREACIALRVSHDNLVATYHADARYLHTPGQQLGTACQMYLVQEYCDQGTLYSALAESRFHTNSSVDKAVIVRCVLDIACGIRALHDAGIIHSDLKPQNVLLTSTGDRHHGRVEPAHWHNIAKLTDFGLSFALESKSHLSGLHVGTPFYLSPEVQSTGHLSKASDIYSLGVLMWELYHGRPPYTTSNGRLVQHAAFPRFTSTSAPFSFAVLTLACLSKNHLHRPSIEEVVVVLEDLNQAINSQNAMLAINADVPSLLTRLMRCSGLKRDPAFYQLIQKAEQAGSADEQASGTNTVDASPETTSESPLGRSKTVETPESLVGIPPLATCHSEMLVSSNGLKVTSKVESAVLSGSPGQVGRPSGEGLATAGNGARAAQFAALSGS